MRNRFQAIVAVLLVLVCVTAAGAQWTFLVMADTQLGMKSGNKDWDFERQSVGSAITFANKLKPAFVVVCGDLVNDGNSDAQVAGFGALFQSLDENIALHLVAGNHDAGTEPTPASLATYRQRFGPDWYSFDVSGCHFVVLNSTLLHKPAQAPADAEAQWQWLEKDLADAARRSPTHTILFQHHPPFVKMPDEPADYNNCAPEQRARLLNLCRQYKVTAMFSGHLHRSGASTAQPPALVTVGPAGLALGEGRSGLCTITVDEHELRYQFLPVEEYRSENPAAFVSGTIAHP